MKFQSEPSSLTVRMHCNITTGGIRCSGGRGPHTHERNWRTGRDATKKRHTKPRKHLSRQGHCLQVVVKLRFWEAGGGRWCSWPCPALVVQPLVLTWATARARHAHHIISREPYLCSPVCSISCIVCWLPYTTPIHIYIHTYAHTASVSALRKRVAYCIASMHCLFFLLYVGGVIKRSRVCPYLAVVPSCDERVKSPSCVGELVW